MCAMFRSLIPILVAVTVPPASSAQEEVKPPPRTPLEVQCDVLFKEFVDANQKWYDGQHRSKSNEEASKFRSPDRTAYAEKFLAIADKNPADPAAVDALVRVLLVDFYGPHWKEAIERIRARHVKSPRIGTALLLIAIDTTPPEVEPLLRDILRDNPSAEVRANAALALAQHLKRLVGESENMREHPDRFEHAVGRFGVDSVTRMRDRDTKAMRKETEALLELVIREYPQVPHASLDPRNIPTLGDMARGELRSMRDRIVGKPAPEIDGKDVEGKPMKLSEYRGKVVILSFWATWCGPCMQMVPHERELVQRLEGKPFVLLGVNGDEGKERLKYQTKEHQINWRSWYDGGPNGPISQRWNVRGWPTVFVIDREGIIRYKGQRDEAQLDAAVNQLLSADR